MKRRIMTLSFITSILFILSCKPSNFAESSSSEYLDTILYNNYLRAVRNGSTFQYFLVVKIKNLNSDQAREICTTGNFLEGALHMEYNIGYDSVDIVKIEKLQLENKERYFEFRETSALNNLGLGSYSMNDLAEFEKSHNVDSLAQIIREGKWSQKIFNDTTMRMYAHTLFKRGILTGENSCFGGTLIHIFEAYEASVFTDVFGWSRESGFEPVDLVTTALRPVIKCYWNLIVQPEIHFEAVNVDDYDALAIPGGAEDAGFFDDAFDESFLNLIREFDSKGKFIGSICVGALPVAKSGVLQNRKATTWDLNNGARRKQMAQLGVHVQDQQVVVDKNIITSTGPATSLSVAFTLLEMLTNTENVNEVKRNMRF